MLWNKMTQYSGYTSRRPGKAVIPTYLLPPDAVSYSRSVHHLCVLKCIKNCCRSSPLSIIKRKYKMSHSKCSNFFSWKWQCLFFLSFSYLNSVAHACNLLLQSEIISSLPFQTLFSHGKKGGKEEKGESCFFGAIKPQSRDLTAFLCLIFAELNFLVLFPPYPNTSTQKSFLSWMTV